MTTEKEDRNLDVLKEFIKHHKLTEKDGVYEFMAITSIMPAISANAIIEQPMHCSIAMKGYSVTGMVTILEKLNTDTQPYRAHAKTQIMEHVDGKYLLITGTHPSNPLIGVYQFKIAPLPQ